MSWPRPAYSRGEVNRAGQDLSQDLLRDDFDVNKYLHSYEVVANWRSCHGYPINTFQATLRQRLKEIDSRALVAQRLKRMPSILNKLRRYPEMQLARMQDIGGLRAVVSSLRKLRRLEAIYRDEEKLEHELVGSKDYVDHPKESGYRSIHLVYRYHNKRASAYENLLLELQLRTNLQHTWATAVETMGTFLDHSLKSSEGPEVWLNFFRLTGAAFARIEHTAIVPGFEHLGESATFRAVSAAAKELRVAQKLQAFAIAADRIVRTDRKSGNYHLVVLDLDQKTVSIQTYGQQNLIKASADYTKIEKQIADGQQLQAVLVSAGPIETLRRAYPNYFLDTTQFMHQITKIGEKAKG